MQTEVLHSKDAVVRDSVRLTMQKIQNGKWTDPNLMDQEYLETIKEKSIRIGRILNANYQNSELEQKVNRSIHLTKFQRVILICCLERY